MDKKYLRGDIYLADLGEGIGSEQKGCRPVVIIQNNIGNRYSPTVIVAAISSRIGIKPKLPTHYFINAENGLELPSIIMLEQIRTVDKQRLEKQIGRLSTDHISGMDSALAISLNLTPKHSHSLTICLCSPCAERFLGTGVYYLKQIHIDNTCACTVCNQKPSHKYEMIQNKTEDCL